MESVGLLQDDRHARLVSNQVHHKAAADNEHMATSVLAESGDRDHNESKFQEGQRTQRTNFYRPGDLCLAIRTETNKIRIQI